MVQGESRLVPSGLEEGVSAIAVAAIKELLKPLVKFVGTHQKRRTLKHAGKLHFWSDGMLEQLTQIAEGKADAKTYSALAKKFRESKDIVEKSMEELTEIRNNLGGGPIARQIDACVHNYVYGKMTIREEITFLLADRKGENNPEEAKLICGHIQTLNAELDRLRRLLDGE